METIEDRLSAALRKSDATIGDAGFSETVMRTLPNRRRLASSGARRCTLTGAAVAGGAATALLGPPLDGAFSWLALGDSSLALVVAALFVTALAATTVWVFWSE
jgi:hypothetical protein